MKMRSILQALILMMLSLINKASSIITEEDQQKEFKISTIQDSPKKVEPIVNTLKRTNLLTISSKKKGARTKRKKSGRKRLLSGNKVDVKAAKISKQPSLKFKGGYMIF